MWIYLNDAFLSIVAHRNERDCLLVRARVRGDIERVFPGATSQETRAADYRFRAVIDRQVVADAIAGRLLEIGYDNFKGSVAARDRHDAYLRVWSTTIGGLETVRAPSMARRRPAKKKRVAAAKKQLELGLRGFRRRRRR